MAKFNTYWMRAEREDGCCDPGFQCQEEREELLLTVLHLGKEALALEKNGDADSFVFAALTHSSLPG